MDKSGPKLIGTVSKNYRNLSNIQVILENSVTLIRTLPLWNLGEAN